MSQYALPLTLPAIYSADMFVVSGSNRDAHRWITSWPNWPAHALYLHGPEASGKSHLGYIWAAMANAHVMPAQALANQDIAAMQGNWLVEDIEQLSQPEPLLHLYNIAREHNAWLLLTGNCPIQQLPLTLPDLMSRLLSLPSTSIGSADDALVAAILRKQFADRQLGIDEDTIAYLLPRIDRSYNKISELIKSMDDAALAQRKKLTIPFIRRLLAFP